MNSEVIKRNYTKIEMQRWRRIAQQNGRLVISWAKEVKWRVLTGHKVLEPGFVAARLRHPRIMPHHDVLHTLVLHLVVSPSVPILLPVEDAVAEPIGARMHGRGVIANVNSKKFQVLNKLDTLNIRDNE